MKTTTRHLLAAAAVTTTLAAGTAQAVPSITLDFQATIASEQHPTYAGEARYYHVSVNPNNPGIGSFAATIVGTNDPAPTFTRPFTDPVVSYKWIGGVNNDITAVAISGGDAARISYATQDTTFDGFGQQQLKFWDVTDPGSDIATGGADPYNAVDDAGNTGGYRSFGGAVGTIDISGLTSGSLYIFYGAFSAKPSVSVVLRDSNNVLPDIVLPNVHANDDTANRTEYYVAEVDFVSDGYDTLVYEHLANGVDYTGNGRGLGTLLTGVTGPAFDPADLDQDGDVDDADFGIAFAAFTGPGGVSNSPADLDDDGDVDDADFGIAFAAFTGPGGGAVVPEPTSLALLGLGGLMIARRRRA